MQDVRHAAFDLEPLDRIALIAHIEALHRLVTERLDSADPPAYAG
jgi:hypothetical protein